MTGVLLIFLLLWLGLTAVYWVATNYFRKSDVKRLRDRIISNHTKKEKRARASLSAPKLISSEDGQTGRLVRRILQRFDLNNRLERLIEQSGLKWRPTRVVHACLALFIGGFMLSRWFFVPHAAIQLAIGLTLSILPILYVYRTRAQRLLKFEEQFPESLEFVARSMRAGHAFSGSLEMIHREFEEPLAGEMRRTFEEHNLGLPLDQALLKLAQRVPSLDVHFFVSAVLLQKRTGGNLAEILDKLAYLIRERFKLRGKIRAISAHGRMTGMALTAIPLGVATIMFYVNPSYVGFFLDSSTGNAMAAAAVGLQVLGYLIISKIVSIEV